MTKKVEIRLGYATTQILSVHATIIDVAAGIFGKKDTTKVKPENDVTAGAPTMEHAIGAMNRLLNFGG